MTKHDLKELAAMGAELGAAKAENERLRKLLTTLRISLNLDDTEYGLSKQEKSSLAADIDAELSRQAEPVCQTMQRPKAECGCPDCGSSLIDWPTAEPNDTFTAVDMATAAAQGFRDGQAAVEQATAKDEREAFEAHMRMGGYSNPEKHQDGSYVSSAMELWWQGWKARATRTAQTEQQPEKDAQADRYTVGDLTYEKVFKAAGLTNLSDLQAVLDAVETAIAQLEQGGWISVEERLPEPGMGVLVYTPPQPGDWPDSVRISIDGIDPESDGDYWVEHGEHYEHWCCIAKGGDDINWHGPSEKAPYTHWMPLPDLPAKALEAVDD